MTIPKKRLNPDQLGDYEVGYGKPPVASRFKKGESGNPSGRPRGARSFVNILRKAMAQKVKVTENGRIRVLTKLEVSIEQLMNQAARGDLKALGMVTQLAQGVEQAPEAEPVQIHKDKDLLASIARRLRGLEPGLTKVDPPEGES